MVSRNDVSFGLSDALNVRKASSHSKLPSFGPPNESSTNIMEIMKLVPSSEVEGSPVVRKEEGWRKVAVVRRIRSVRRGWCVSQLFLLRSG